MFLSARQQLKIMLINKIKVVAKLLGIACGAAQRAELQNLGHTFGHMSFERVYIS